VPVSEGMIASLIDLDRADEEGLTARLTGQLRSLIASGRLGKGDVLPSSRRLASDLGVSRNTVTYAFEQLAAEGYLAASHGRRPVVTGGEPFEAAGAAAMSARSARPRLSPWGSRLAQADWPMSYQAPLKPLRPGHGDAREFPHEIWARCLRRSAVRAAKRELGPVNRTRLREALAQYLATSRGVRATVDQVMILPSAQAALTLIASVLITPGDEVWVEDPGYPGAAAAFRASGARVTGMTLDAQGMQRMPGTAAPKLIFMTPSHQHPTGRLMSLARRSEFLRLSRPGETWIVEDDYDGEFRYGHRPIDALQSMDTEGRVIYIGTFSKALSPQLRLGYLVLPRELAPAFRQAKQLTDRHAPLLDQRVLASLIESGTYERHVRRQRRGHERRRAALLEAVARHLPEESTIVGSAADMSIVQRVSAPCRSCWAI